MKRFVMKAGAALFAGVLLWAMPATALAAGDVQPPKEEVVYAKLAADGSLQSGYVVNSFDLTRDMSFTDYGDYTKAHNLSTLDPLAVRDGAVDISASAGRFYYQGDLNDPALPWTISIGYTLNGKPVTAEELAGASGYVKITLDVYDNPDAEAVFTDNYTLQIELTLNTQRCTGIIASGATVANAGKNKVVNFIRMPGGDTHTHYSVNMSVKDFEMDGIRIAGIPYNISVDTPDTGELTGELAKLQDGIGELNDAVQLLSGGTGQFKTGFDQFAAGLSDMEDALAGMQGGLSQLVAGNPDLQAGLAQIEQALIDIQTNLDAFGQVSADLEELLTGSASVLTGLGQLSDGLAALEQSFALTDQGVYEMTGHAYEGLQQANEAMIATLNAQIAVLMEDPEGNAAEIEQLLSIVALLGANNDLIAGLKVGICGDGTPENPGLANAAATLAAQYQFIDEAIQGLPDMLGELTDGIAQLKAGIDQLVPNFSDLKGGLDEYLEGTLSLYQGFVALYAGFSDIVDGSGDLGSNITSLRNGIRDLAAGSAELYGETLGMDTKMRARIDEMMDDYTSHDFTVISFVSDRNTNVDSVQFVFLTGSIVKQEPEPVTEEEAVPTTIWQRFLALFR